MIARGANLSSWVFQGMNREGNWITLDERRTIPGIPWNSREMAFLVDTDCYFTGFRFKDTRGVALTLAGLEIHGAIRFQPGLGLVQQPTDGEQTVEPDFDPWTVPELD
jgi:hypothetical protein